MYSKRGIEDLSIEDIKKDLERRYIINDTIINNASIETSKIKQQFGDRILAFFNIYLAAALLSSFVLYSLPNYTSYNKWMICLCVIFITEFVLLLYSVAIYKKFSIQYMRQKNYREINNAIMIIKTNLPTFFNLHSNADTYISISTLNQLASVIKNFCEAKNKRGFIDSTLWREWKGIFVAILIVVILMIATFGLIIGRMVCCG